MSDTNRETGAADRSIQGLHYGSLCTGIGGLDLAVEAHFGATAAWHSEVEPAPCTVLERHWPGVPNLGDLTALDWAVVPPVDILSAGYPCQPFSFAGKRKGKNDARHLWPYIIAAVRHLRPRWVVAENVRGHLSLGFDEVLWSLAEAGFDAEWCVLRASDVGACHRRERLVFVARDAAGAPQDAHAEAGPPRGRSRESGGDVAADTDEAGPQGPQPARRRLLFAGGGSPATDPYGVAGATERPLQGRPNPVDEPRQVERVERLRGVDWGEYGSAIGRWSSILGRSAPPPLDNEGRLSPAFVEWMMGYPEGWVDGLTRTQALKALGNAVVPQQGLAALRELAPEAVLNGAAA